MAGYVGGYSAKGDLIFFLDAVTRLAETFFENFVSEVERRGLEHHLSTLPPL
jgi:hypothetical protein